MSDSSPEHTPGEITWLEIPVSDAARAQAFYLAVLGFEATPGAPQPMPGYTDGVDGVYMFTKGKMHGAFVKMSRPEGIANVADEGYVAKMPVLPTYMVESLEKTLEVVEEKGGKRHMPVTPIAGGTMGACARFIDTEGNLVSIWSPPAKGGKE